jgi:hypothetical protein
MLGIYADWKWLTAITKLLKVCRSANWQKRGEFMKAEELKGRIASAGLSERLPKVMGDSPDAACAAEAACSVMCWDGIY